MAPAGDGPRHHQGRRVCAPCPRSTLSPISSFHPRPRRRTLLRWTGASLAGLQGGAATARAAQETEPEAQPGGPPEPDAAPRRRRRRQRRRRPAAGPPGSPDLRRRSRPGLRRADPRPPARGGHSGQLRDHRELGPRPSGPGGADGGEGHGHGHGAGTCSSTTRSATAPSPGSPTASAGSPPKGVGRSWRRRTPSWPPILGRSTRPWYRLPYGDSDPRVAADVAPTGLTRHAGWTVDSLGWQGPSAPEIVARCLRLASPRATTSSTWAAGAGRPGLGAPSRAAPTGYRFVTLEGLDPL